ncbi:hypothetical protein ABIF50_003317 [Bradyrhizobium diazoefficiens]
MFGLDENGRAKGARFSSQQIGLALEATLTLKLEVFEAVSSEMQELATKLPSGHVYAKRASLPFIEKTLYERLHAAFGGLVRDQGDEATGDRDTN